MLSQKSLDLGLPSSENDSQNPSNDKVIPSQCYNQTSYLAHIEGKAVMVRRTQPLESDKAGTESQLHDLLAL